MGVALRRKRTVLILIVGKTSSGKTRTITYTQYGIPLILYNISHLRSDCAFI
jgi:hypothetical protein